MTEEPKLASAVKQEAGGIASAATVYAAALGIVYLWGYWSSFSLNILEYLSLWDVLKASALPLAITVASVMVGLVFGEATTGPGTIGDRATSAVAEVLFKVRRFVPPTFGLAFVAALVLDYKDKWIVVGGMVSVVVVIMASNATLVTRWLPVGRYRAPALFVIVYLPWLAWNAGQVNAAKIVNGERYLYATGSIDGLARTGEGPASSPRLLGYAADKYFFLIPTAGAMTIALVPKEQARSLSLRLVERRAEVASIPGSPPASQAGSVLAK